MIIAIKPMCYSINSCIRYKGIKSDFINLQFGVKQGDPSSSLLCLFFLNDIIQHINTDIDGIMTLEELKLLLLFFADDAVLFAQHTRSWQSMLYDLETYCNTWGYGLYYCHWPTYHKVESLLCQIQNVQKKKAHKLQNLSNQ